MAAHGYHWWKEGEKVQLGTLLQSGDFCCSVFFDLVEDAEIKPREPVIFLGQMNRQGGSWEVYVLTPQGVGWMWVNDLRIPESDDRITVHNNELVFLNDIQHTGI